MAAGMAAAHKARMMIEGRSGSRGGRFGGRRNERRGLGFSPEWGENFAEHGGRGFGGGRGRGGRGRMFAGGELRLLLLRLLADETRHGYELIKAIDELTGGNYAPSPGVVYPTLSLLVDEGVIAPQDGEGARKAFAATDAGRTELASKADAAEALLARLRSLADSREREGEAPIRRAVGNLVAALRNRTSGADLETETVHAIVDVLDDAAKRIERL